MERLGIDVASRIAVVSSSQMWIKIILREKLVDKGQNFPTFFFKKHLTTEGPYNIIFNCDNMSKRDQIPGHAPVVRYFR